MKKTERNGQPKNGTNYIGRSHTLSEEGDKMAQKRGFDLLKEKVPELGNPLKMAGIVAAAVLIFLGIMVFFQWFDGLKWYGALVSQLIVALVCSVFSRSYVGNAEKYRKKYANRAYRNFFFHFVILLLVTGNACIFHPLLVKGPPLLPVYLALALGTFFVLMRFLLEWHIHKSGFDEIGHGLGIFMVFPEEAQRVSSDIYSYLRHPMFTGDLCLALGLALLRNNLLAVFTAVMCLIPFLVEARLEDRELVKRFGEEHTRYIRETPAIFPRLEDIGKFFTFLFLRRTKKMSN